MDHGAIVVGGAQRPDLRRLPGPSRRRHPRRSRPAPTVGGCASTVDALGARVNICNCDHTVFRSTPVIEELDLAAHGLRYLDVDPAQLSMLVRPAARPGRSSTTSSAPSPRCALTYPSEVDGLPPLPGGGACRWPSWCSSWPTRRRRPGAVLRPRGRTAGPGRPPRCCAGAARASADVLRGFFREDAVIAPGHRRRPRRVGPVARHAGHRPRRPDLRHASTSPRSGGRSVAAGSCRPRCAARSRPPAARSAAGARVAAIALRGRAGRGRRAGRRHA